MSTTPSIDTSSTAPQLSVADLTLADLSSPSAAARAGLLLCLPELDAASLEAALAAIAATFPDEDIQVAIPGPPVTVAIPSTLHIVQTTADLTRTGWVLAAADYTAAASLAGDDTPHAVLLLADPAAVNHTLLLRRLADAVRSGSVDLVLPRFTLGPSDGLVNSAILYPLTRALFGADIRFPLPVDAALSTRMLQRLASIGHRQIALGQSSALIWPVAEAAIAGFSVRQADADAGPPTLSAQDDFNALFASIAGSLFADIEAKASFWQRARSFNPSTPSEPFAAPAADSAGLDPDIQPMIESFHLAQANLQEIWSLVLPPQSRLALKKLSLESPAQFSLEPALWARVVYDFVLAFHLRTLNRGHLLGALIPLYLAWVASHLRAAANDAALAARHVDETAAAFETEKSYLVSRWRWPDRFNP
jgi:hypothetical protein